MPQGLTYSNSLHSSDTMARAVINDSSNPEHGIYGLNSRHMHLHIWFFGSPCSWMVYHFLKHIDCVLEVLA